VSTLGRGILDALEDYPQGICDSCLRLLLHATSHQTINGACLKLEIEGRLVREKSKLIECERCKKNSITNRLIPLAPQPPVEPLQVARGLFGISELDDLRRKLIQYLNAIDPLGSKEGFSRRVANLRNSQTLPSVIASLMLTHAAYRNELYYTPRPLNGDEVQILQAIDKYLRIHIAPKTAEVPTASRN